MAFVSETSDSCDHVEPVMISTLAVHHHAVEGWCMKIAFRFEARSDAGLKRSKNDDSIEPFASMPAIGGGQLA